ncbi:hypothetical protein Leryth_009409 [Lithospermum erythrorhizon]|nr:hypothetical protein Leryth_009409 [Lithospermum erythrorhizon]
MGLIKDKGIVYKHVDNLDLGNESNEEYLRANVKAPRMAGFLVKAFVWLIELPIIGTIVVYFLKKNNLIHKLVSFADLQESPLFVPFHPYNEGVEAKEAIKLEHDMSPQEQVQLAMDCLKYPERTTRVPEFCFYRWTIEDYSRAYISGKITPLLVAERLVAAVYESCNASLKMSFFINFNVEDIMKQATESTLRYARGEQISILDGVPIAIKDEIDCTPYPTTGGTKWLHKLRHCSDDAYCVKRLRLCGSLLIGKTNMHELGAGTSGINPHHGIPRNPYDTRKITGGSSSGSASVVAAGLCPVALGVDGGGSVRMPASLCGVVGFKPSFGRVSHNGVLPLNWTVGMVGILAATVEDALVVSPKLCLPMLQLSSSTLCIKLAKYGEIIDITLPEVENMRLAHYVTMGSECSTSIARHLEKIDMTELGGDIKVALSVYGSFHSSEYLNAQKISVTAYTIKDDASKTGELDYINGAALVRYQIAGNFLGLPAISVPVGYDKCGLPIGLQFIGKPWSESFLLQMAFSLQLRLF